MLWDHYVFRRGNAVHELWDSLLQDRPAKLLYIAGRGFDVRAQAVMREFVAGQRGAGRRTVSAKLLLLGLDGYELDKRIQELTDENAAALKAAFSPLGETTTITIETPEGEEEASASDALRQRVKTVLDEMGGKTDIILDVSSLPRATYLALLTNILQKLVPNKTAVEGGAHPLYANGVNFQVLVAEDAKLDGQIRAEDPSNDLLNIPGFFAAWQAERVQDWPLVWFPVLGEGRVNQLQKIAGSIPTEAEVCPVVPHPSKDPRQADRLLVEYREPLFDSRKTPTSNILYAHELQPFEAYRQLLGAMLRYQHSMTILGGCRLVMTPLGSKLITLGAGLACFEMRPSDLNAKYGVAIPHAEPRRYLASVELLQQSKPDVSLLLLTGEAYSATG
ncbi:hypothetical protein [Aromatoleum petrolei]|uniref:Uncharacterized protein n=1 Tax=Aromatoleum petrolei TaxID=76116 RepID=A0ABX1MPB7_9RHOO|nr:hypothetical protein [Aromatoleum petrolei]NMF88185.1 hypothetical protein [Aromatoleum petrolei]QTQ38957.1 Uncharacterized protein ToN1_48610 [Aromatoleum petrolei]